MSKPGDLPISRGTGVNWRSVEQIARTHPGEWVLAGKQIHRGYSHHIRSGKIAAFRREGWQYEVATRERRVHKADLYVRAVPANHTEREADSGGNTT